MSAQVNTVSAAQAAPVVRLATLDDIDALMELERAKWTSEQATTPAEMAARIRANPELCIAAFCSQTGRALGSVFLKPIAISTLHSAETWADCAAVEPRTPEIMKSRALFGISLSSVSHDAVDLIGVVLWARAMKSGWREIYLGSPIPGFRSWRASHPDTPTDEYVYGTRRGAPRDPQLRYYHGKGYRRIVAWKADYFPHEASLDHGVVIRAAMPLAWAWPLWRVLPLRAIERLGSLYLTLRTRVE